MENLTKEEFEKNNPGYILVPWVSVPHTEESLKEYNDFMKEYRTQHKCCPKCGAEGHMTTLMGYILNRSKEYKDLNNCTCTECGDKHVAHDRVKSEK